MGTKTKIQWTDATWNPITGCTKISAGCQNCYAERFAERFRGVKGHPFESGFDLILRHDRIQQPLSWRNPRMVFVNSMSDLFHKDVPEDYIKKVFDTMEKAFWHDFQVLTKRSDLMRDFVSKRYKTRNVPHNIWLGVSIESRQVIGRADHLRDTPAAIRFLSLEPLIGPVGKINLNDIHWVIVGGESGCGSRMMKHEWVADIRDQCSNTGVAFFFKQWGGAKPKLNGRMLDGVEWSGFPATPLTQPPLFTNATA
jgi:protein gp37